MRFEFIAKHRGIWPVSWICEALGVSRSGFHAWLVRAPSKRARSDEELGARVRASFISSYRTYGARRVWHDLLAEGLSCGLHRIERLMRVHGLRARPRRRGLPKDDGLRSVIADNILDRQFTAEAPNQRWIADFTYIWTAEGWLYVAVVIDLFSRRVVGWSMSDTMTAQLVTDALMMAIWRRGKPDALLHHSDQGSQYTSEQFQRLMADNGVTCSMSRSGNVWDNAAMESFFSSMKTERIGRKTYRTRNHAKADVFDYIERFYNPTRRHSTLGYLSPMDFERQAHVAYGPRDDARQRRDHHAGRADDRGPEPDLPTGMSEEPGDTRERNHGNVRGIGGTPSAIGILHFRRPLPPREAGSDGDRHDAERTSPAQHRETDRRHRTIADKVDDCADRGARRPDCGCRPLRFGCWRRAGGH